MLWLLHLFKPLLTLYDLIVGQRSCCDVRWGSSDGVVWNSQPILINFISVRYSPSRSNDLYSSRTMQDLCCSCTVNFVLKETLTSKLTIWFLVFLPLVLIYVVGSSFLHPCKALKPILYILSKHPSPGVENEGDGSLVDLAA